MRYLGGSRRQHFRVNVGYMNISTGDATAHDTLSDGRHQRTGALRSAALQVFALIRSTPTPLTDAESTLMLQ
jgi:hypothetical protein